MFSGPVAKSARFLLSLYRNQLNNFFIKETGHVGKCGRFCLSLRCFLHFLLHETFTRPRCEIWPVFFVPSRIWPFLGDLRAFRRLDGTSYRPGRKSVLNRKFAENNFFWPET